MTEIGLMMTGVLTARQASGPNLPEQQLLQMEHDINQSKRSQSEITPQVTPPEFMQTDANLHASLEAIALEKEHTVQKINKKNQFPPSGGLAQPQKYSQSVGKNRAKSGGKFDKYDASLYQLSILVVLVLLSELYNGFYYLTDIPLESMESLGR